MCYKRKTVENMAGDMGFFFFLFLVKPNLKSWLKVTELPPVWKTRIEQLWRVFQSRLLQWIDGREVICGWQNALKRFFQTNKQDNFFTCNVMQSRFRVIYAILNLKHIQFHCTVSDKTSKVPPWSFFLNSGFRSNVSRYAYPWGLTDILNALPSS